jgi:uroporphyrin-III C-methyltransferase / precorrin-2 dehydrogenase / sirohydrochlorin ferrochelatase
MDLLPTFLKLAGRRVLVVGAGPVAASKLDALSRAGADITVVAPEVHPSIGRTGVRVETRRFEAADLDGAWFVVAAATPEVNAEVAREAERRGVFVYAVDAPALAGALREAIDALLPADLDRWSACARDLRLDWKRSGVPMAERRPQLIEALKRLYP